MLRLELRFTESWSRVSVRLRTDKITNKRSQAGGFLGVWTTLVPLGSLEMVLIIIHDNRTLYKRAVKPVDVIEWTV